MHDLGEVEIENLTKTFGDIVAVDHVDLSIPEGSIFGLLGPNGAGKSTTTRLLCTLLKPDEGTASVGGHDILKEPVRVRQITGVLPEEGNHTLYPTMTAYENLQYFARLYGVREAEIPERIEQLLVFMDLWTRKDDKAGELSTGNRQRLALCRAMLHKPRVLLLDEPTSALDPIAAKRVRELIMDLAEKYKQTFFINSHNLAEVQRMCDRIAIIDDGKILLAGETKELRSRLQAKQEFTIRVAGEPERAAAIAGSNHSVEAVRVGFDSISVTIMNPIDNNWRLMQDLLTGGIRIIEFTEDEATLEELYLEVVKGGRD